MKLNKWILGVLSLGVMASCSNNDVPDAPGSGNLISHNGDYMAIGINLPSTPSTRAANDTLADGTPEEYKVSNGCIALFVGESPEKAQFAAAYDLKGLDSSAVPDVDDDNITTSYKKSVRLDNFSYAENEEIYAFVMLNYTGLATVTEDNGLTINGKTLQKKGFTQAAKDDENTEEAQDENTNESVTEPVPVAGTTFKDAFLVVTRVPFNSSINGKLTNFFMCNSPLANVKGGESATAPTDAQNFAIETLVKLNKDNIWPTQAEAEANGHEAGSVNVERGLAKASIDWQPKGFTGSNVATVDSKKISFKFIGWNLDVTESSSYICRNVMQYDETAAPWWDYINPDAPNYRFIGNAEIGNSSIQDDQDLYRTYWCIDPHYSTDLNSGKSEIDFVSAGQPLYCYENTFNVAHQNYRNTTRAVFQATLQFGEPKEGDDSNKGTTFYVLNGVESQIYLELDDVESYPRKLILESEKIVQALKIALKNPDTSFDTADAEKVVKITFERNNANGIRSVKDIAFNVAADDPKFNAPAPLSDDDKKKLIDGANTEYVITEYVDGNTYYDLRFMHFADESNKYVNKNGDLAPWNIDSKIAASTSEAYPGPDAEKNWLGRYGMVRNNWYEIAVTGVKTLGEPVIPDVTGSRGNTSDDDKKNYLSFKINVLSWAKRSQSHVF